MIIKHQILNLESSKIQLSNHQITKSPNCSSPVLSSHGQVLQHASSPWTNPTKTLLWCVGLFIIIRLALISTVYLSNSISPGTLPSFLLSPRWQPLVSENKGILEPWFRWDAVLILNIAQSGYSGTYSVFPIFSIIIHIINKLIGNLYLSGLLITNICSFTALVGIYVYFRELEDKNIAKLATILLYIFPTAFIFAQIYTETIYLCFAVWSLYAAHKNRWYIGSILGALAAGSRFVGICLFPCLLIELFNQWKTKNNQNIFYLLKRLLWLLLVPAVLITYFIYLYKLTGDIMIYFSTQRFIWGRRLVLPWVGYLDGLVNYSPSLEYFLNILLPPLFLWLGIDVWKRWGAALGLFGLIGIIFPLCSDNLLGMPRYIVVLFPCFLSLALQLQKRAIFLWGYAVISAVLMLYSQWQFTAWKISF